MLIEQVESLLNHPSFPKENLMSHHNNTENSEHRDLCNFLQTQAHPDERDLVLHRCTLEDIQGSETTSRRGVVESVHP